MTKRLFFLFSFLLSSSILFGQHNDLPKGVEGKEADELALKIQHSIDYTAWQKTRFVQWTFVGKRDFIWDKFEQKVLVKWDNFKVIFSTKNQTGIAFKDDQPVVDSNEKQQLIDKAIEAFNNDSFWLIAPVKVFDKGTVRKLVQLENNKKGLLVTYTSGGNTPGDSYLWIVDENGRPTDWKMWVSIIKQGGIPNTWENWQKTQTGVWIALDHKYPKGNVKLTNVKTGFTLADIGISTDTFK